MKHFLTTILILALANFSFAQPSKNTEEQQFCNKIKEHIIAREFKLIYPLLSEELKQDSAKILKATKKYGLYIDSHLLSYSEYWGYKDSTDTYMHYGFRWASSQNTTKCLLEIVCEGIDENFIVTELIFISRIGSLQSKSFPENAVCTYPLEKISTEIKD